jgi:hypothetical protein
MNREMHINKETSNSKILPGMNGIDLSNQNIKEYKVQPKMIKEKYLIGKMMID